MKKLTLLGMALLLSVSAIQVQAQEIDYSTNTSTDVFDFAPWNNRALLKLFADASDAGLKYPTQEMFEQAGFNLDLEFSRSHVRPATIMEDPDKNIVSNANGVYPYRRFWLNTPTSQGDMIGGYPSGDFHEEVFSMWQYVQLYGAWNHSILQAPGSWADAAHKNGSHMFSGIEFFESWGTTSSAYNTLIKTKNSDGSYRYVDAFLNALRFLGLDGINYNFEDDGYKESDVVGFHQALYKRAKEIGFDSFHIGLYTSSSSLSSDNANSSYGSNGNKTADLMLNYAGSNFSYAMKSSVEAAEAAMGTADGLYAGVWISNLNGRGWDRLNADETTKKCGICCWGEHKVSRLFQYTAGTSLIDLQTNYQTLLEKFFSGEYRTPLRRPDVSSSGYAFQVQNSVGIDGQLIGFPGIASYAPERTAIQGNLPFNTHFTLGNGDFYAYKGKKTLDAWYNMGQQDYVPTYRWLLYQKGTTNESTALNVAFTHKDAYIGGSALHLTSSATGSGTDVVLYRAKLNVTGSNPKVTVALKSGKEGTNASNLSVIVKKFNNSTWYETTLGNLTGKEWQEQEVALNGISSGDVIEYIGLRVNGGVSNYDMLVGKLMLSDDRAAVTPAEIDAASIVGEIKGETNKSMSVKLTWEVNTTGFSPALIDYGMVYNDEVNIDHFEIFYKNGEDGLVSEIGRTSTWSAYVPNLKFTDDSDDPYVGIRSVSVDMKTFSPVVWIHLDRATGNLPAASNTNYPATYLDTASDGYTTALTNRFLAKVTTSGATKDLNYSRSTAVGDENYVFEEDHVLKIAQGQKVTLTINGYNTSDDIRYCIGIGYMDWDINYEFDATNDEKLFEVGSQNSGTASIVTGYTTTINVPTDAAIGNTRLRMVFSDAWFPHPGAAGATNKGFSIDFPVEITGTNTPREPDPGYKGLRDTGVAEQPEGIEDGGTIDPDPDPNPNPNPNPDPTPDPTYQTPSGTIHSGRTTYVEHIYTENLTPNLDKEWSSAPSSVYQLVDQTITLEPGQSFNLHLDAYSAGPASSTQSYQDLRYTRAFIYTDWDRDGTFTQEQIYGVKSPQATDNPNNVLANYNTVMEINQALTVPASASLGGSRIRVIYHNAWEDLNNGANSTNIKEGMAYDIPVKVEDPTAIDETKAGSVSSFYPTVANDAIHFNNVEKAWLYTIDGQFIQFIDNNPESANVSDLAPGLYVVKMQNGQIIRSQKLIKE